MSDCLPGLSHRDLAEALLPAILEAGRIEMRYYNSVVEVQSKSDNSPVTLADQEAERVLLAALARIAPAVPVIAEEAVSAGHVPEIGEAFFLVDPLDGTREFINKRGEFTVNVALIVKRQPVFGIVYTPAMGELYVTLAADRCGMGLVAPDAGPRDLAACKLRDIETRQPDLAGLAAVASRSHLTPETEAYLARFSVRDRKDAGSSLKFCLIARGDADIYPRLGPTMEWDTAAGHAVLVAAGGLVTDTDGQPFLYGKADAGYRNGHFVAWGRAALAEGR